MAEFPALPLFTDAYIADTRHLSAAQHGAYLLLLMAAWRSTDCALPDDDKMLARYAAMDLRTWKKNRDVVLAFWSLNDEHKWVQRRLLDEREYSVNVRNKNAQAGKASALKRKNRHSTTVATKTQPNSNPLTLPTIEDSLRSSSTQREKFVLPDFIPKKDWEDYCEMRRLIKKPMTSRAKSDAIHALSDLQAKGHPPADVLRQSIFNSWAGLFAIKADTGNSARTHKPNPDGPKTNVVVL